MKPHEHSTPGASDQVSHLALSPVGERNAAENPLSNAERPGRRWSIDRWLQLLGLIVLARFVVAAYQEQANISDDAYISFRFAQHLADGHGLVWNIGGPPTEGYTNFLWVLIVAGWRLAGWNPEMVFPFVMGAATLGTAIVLLRVLRRHFAHSTPWGPLLVGLFVADRYTAVHTISGLETPLAVLLVALAISAVLDFISEPSDGRALGVAVIFVLSLLTRPDLGLIVAGLSTALLIDWRQIGWRRLTMCFGCVLVLSLAYVGWKVSYFGYLLPNPFYVKSAPENVWRLSGLREVLRFFDHVQRETWPMWIPIVAWWIIRPSNVSRMWTAARARLGDRSVRPLMLAVVIPPLVSWIYYATIIPDVGFASRFSYPTYPFVLLWAAALASLWASTYRPAPSAITAVIVIAVLLSVVAREPWGLAVRTAAFPTDLHAPIAAALTRSNLGPKVSLSFVAAGLIPYRSGVNHIDPIGLTDNALSGRYPMSRDQYEDIFWSQRADVYLSAEPPASPGATSHSDEPLMAAGYVRHLLTGAVRLYGIAWRHPRFGTLTPSENRAFIHRRMRRLRDEYVWLGEHYSASLWRNLRWRLFVYVRADSLYRVELTNVLRPIVDIPSTAVDLRRAEPRPPTVIAQAEQP